MFFLQDGAATKAETASQDESLKQDKATLILIPRGKDLLKYVIMLH